MRRSPPTNLAILSLLVAACGDGPSKSDGSSPSPVDAGPDVFDSMGCTYLPVVEVVPGNNQPEFYSQVQSALRLLCQSDSDVGVFSYESLATGRVLVDRLQDMTDLDYRTALVFRDLDPATISREEAMSVLVDSVYGYMWGNRIYLNMDVERDTIELAETLAHEVNHVLNRSDENYYLPLDREVSEAERVEILDALRTDPDRAFMEEYRAFYIQEVLNGNASISGPSQSMRGLKIWVRDLYGFDDVDIDALPDLPTGLLVPDESGWAASPPSFCSGDLLYFPCE